MTHHVFNMAVKHWTIENIMPEWFMTRDDDAIPLADWPHWVRYSSPFESNKLTCRDIEKLPTWIMMAMNHAISKTTTMAIRELSGIPDLIPAPFAHGGGLHVMEPGGHLDPHIDYAIHPDAPFLERRASLIVFLSDLDSQDGGQLQFWNDDVSKVLVSHLPRFNKGVLFLNSDTSFHSVTKITGNKRRASLAIYFCAPTRPGVNRRRALWVPIRS